MLSINILIAAHGNVFQFMNNYTFNYCKAGIKTVKEKATTKDKSAFSILASVGIILVSHLRHFTVAYLRKVLTKK